MSVPETGSTSTTLKRSAIGVPGIVFFVVAAAAPLAATLGGSPIAFMSTGVGAPGAYVLVGVVLVLFAVGYAAMSRYVTSSAGFAAYLEASFGRTSGFAGGAVALLAYNCMLIGLYGLFGFLTTTVVADLFDAETDWKMWALLGWAAVAILGYLDVNLSAKLLGVLMVGEVAILLIFDIAVIAQGGGNGLNVESFQPSNVFSDGIGVALLFAAGSFVGFEATAIYGEEAKDPVRTIPRATYVAVVLIAVFYALSTWAIVLAYGGEVVRQAALDNPAGMVFAVNDQFVGAWSTTIMNVLLVTSTFAVLLAFHNTLSRYMFALGRARVLPGALGRTHERSQAPHRASVVGSAVTGVVIGTYALVGADPYTELYALLVGVGTLGIIALQAATCVAVIVFFVRKKRAELRVWNCVIAPALGAAGLVVAAYLAVDNWAVLTGATDGVPALLPWLVVLAAAVGVGWASLAHDSARSLAGAFDSNENDPSRAIISGAAAPVPSAETTWK